VNLIGETACGSLILRDVRIDPLGLALMPPAMRIALLPEEVSTRSLRLQQLVAWQGRLR
jgi:hypothetical protein